MRELITKAENKLRVRLCYAKLEELFSLQIRFSVNAFSI